MVRHGRRGYYGMVAGAGPGGRPDVCAIHTHASHLGGMSGGDRLRRGGAGSFRPPPAFAGLGGVGVESVRTQAPVTSTRNARAKEREHGPAILADEVPAAGWLRVAAMSFAPNPGR